MNTDYDDFDDFDSHCPSCVSSSPDATSGFAIHNEPFYACYVEQLRDMPDEQASAYMRELWKNHMTYDTDKVADIYSRGTYEEVCLSNFCRTDFMLDGVNVKSMEGFLQSLKTSDEDEQRRICSLQGKDAKKAGLAVMGFDGENLYWKGKTINRFSEEYHALVRRAYRARFEQDEDFRKALKATKNKKLLHTIGNNDPKATILTTDEFIGFLRALQEEL